VNPVKSVLYCHNDRRQDVQLVPSVSVFPAEGVPHAIHVLAWQDVQWEYSHVPPAMLLKRFRVVDGA